MAIETSMTSGVARETIGRERAVFPRRDGNDPRRVGDIGPVRGAL